MIRLLAISDIPTSNCDEIWVIVRYLKHPIRNTVHVPELAPSNKLVGQYLNWRRQGKWGHDTFQNLYVPLFLKEIHDSPEAIQKLDEAWIKSKNGKTIGLACYCDNEALCHRSIVGGLLAGTGCELHSDFERNYSHYYNQYIQL